MKQEEMIFSYQTRLKGDYPACSSYAKLFGCLERKLFAALMGQKDPVLLKKLYIQDNGITARQFNSLLYQVTGKIQAAKELQKLHSQELEEKIADLKKQLPKFKDQVLFGKKRRLALLTKKLKNIKQKIQDGQVSICFGGKKLFRKQFEVEDHAAWKKEWEDKRNQGFFSIGSKDETGGNQSCTWIKQQDGNLSLRVRLPHSLEKLYGKYLLIEDLHFDYGHQEIIDALHENQQRNTLLKIQDPTYLNYGRAITCRFLRDEKGWRVFVSLSKKKKEIISSRQLGAFGIDVNVDHLATSDIDRFGNTVAHKKHPLNLYGKNNNQALALIQEVAKEIVSLAKERKKPIVLEELDFQKKKQALRNDSPKRARMLSSFAYRKILEAIKARAYKEGIEVLQVSPAYTSMIGHIKYAKRFGLSKHEAAAFCVGRRGLGFLETLPYGKKVDLLIKGDCILFELPVRKVHLDHASYLKTVSKKYQAVHGEHFKAEKIRSFERKRSRDGNL